MVSLLAAALISISAAEPHAEAEAPDDDTALGFHLGVSSGLFALDFQHSGFYAFGTVNILVPVLLSGRYGAFAVGAGISVPLGEPDSAKATHWVFDFFALANPGWHSSGGLFGQPGVTNSFVGVGVGVGFRFLHESGLTLGFKLPLLGTTLTPQPLTTGVGDFFLANAVALPAFSVGFSF